MQSIRLCLVAGLPTCLNPAYGYSHEWMDVKTDELKMTVNECLNKVIHAFGAETICKPHCLSLSALSRPSCETRGRRFSGKDRKIEQACDICLQAAVGCEDIIKSDNTAMEKPALQQKRSIQTWPSLASF